MAAATKNKRGRPADSLYADAVRRNISNRAYKPEISARAVQNAVNAEEFTCLLIESDSNIECALNKLIDEYYDMVEAYESRKAGGEK